MPLPPLKEHGVTDAALRELGLAHLTAFREAVLGISSWVRMTYGMDKTMFIAGLIEMTRALAKQEAVDFDAALELGMKWPIPDSI
jgi:hypothetical protein